MQKEAKKETTSDDQTLTDLLTFLDYQLETTTNCSDARSNEDNGFLVVVVVPIISFLMMMGINRDELCLRIFLSYEGQTGIFE